MKSYFFLIFALLLFSFCSCEEFFDFFRNPDTKPGSEIRITALEGYYTDTIQVSNRQEFIYAGDRIDTVIHFSNDLYPDSITEYSRSAFNYNGNNLTENILINGTVASKTEYVTEGDKIIKTTESFKKDGGSWQTETMVEYIYEGDKLTSLIQHDFDLNGQKTKSAEDVYTYNGNLMTRCDQFYNTWFLDQYTWEKNVQMNFHYTNNKLDTISYLYLQPDRSYKLQYMIANTYRENLMEKTEYIYPDNNTQAWKTQLTVQYRYDSNGILSGQIRSHIDGALVKLTYEWENKSGNIGLLWSIPYQRQLGISLLKSSRINDLYHKTALIESMLFK